MYSKRKFLLLIICILFSLAAKSQNLHLKIQGEDSLKTAVIDSLGYQKQFSSYQNLSLAVDSLFLQVQEMGFFDAQTSLLEKKNDSMYVSRFFLGQKYHVLKIYYDELPLDEKTMKKLTADFHPNYFSVPVPKIKAVLSSLNQQIANQGRPFSFVQLKNIRKGKNGMLLADLKSISSKARKIDEIVVKGYEKFPVSFLKHFVGIKIGQPFNKKLLEKKMKRLLNVPFASNIKPPEVQFTKDSTTIFLYLKKEKSNTFEGFLGFSNDQDNNKLQLTGNVDVLLRNNLNFGESLNIHYRSNGGGQTKFNAALALPYLFQTPIGVDLGLEIFKKDSSYVNVGQHAKINYQLSAQVNTFIGYRHAESNNLQDDTFQATGSLIEDFTADYLTLGGLYLDYNEISDLFPIRAKLGIELAHGKRAYTGGTSKQWIISTKAAYIFQLNRHNSIYIYNESSILSSDDYLTNELFRFGGINSIRGFAENSISASLFSVTQTEYRYLLSSNLYAHTIIDYAYYENKPLDLKKNLYGIGFGFGLKTQAGVLRINFANGKADGQNFEFSNTKIHLGLISIF